MHRQLKMIASGGQTGVDRAALEAALTLGFPCGGWCPLGRRAEDGRIPERFLLRETPSSEYAQRTRWNVRDTQGTLIITRGAVTGGTALTLFFARELNRFRLVIDFSRKSPLSAQQDVLNWLRAARIEFLNVAGPRESSSPGIYLETIELMQGVLSQVQSSAEQQRRLQSTGQSSPKLVQPRKRPTS